MLNNSAKPTPVSARTAADVWLPCGTSSASHRSSQRGFFSEERTKPLLDEANAIVRILGKGVSTTRRRISGEPEVANLMDKDGQ